MSRHADRRPVRRSLRAAVLLLVVTTLLIGGRASFAFFTDSATITSSGIAAGSVSQPVLNAPAASGSGVQLSWAKTAVGSAFATGYAVTRYSSASGGTATPVCTVSSPTTSCTDSSPSTSTAWYELKATFATNWSATSARTSYTPIAAPPGNLRCTSAGFFGLGSYIEWDAPAGPTPDSYLVSYTSSRASGTAPVNDTQWRPSGLANGTYTVQVAAVTNGVTSALSTGSEQISRVSFGTLC